MGHTSKKAISSGRKGEGYIFKRGQTYYLEYVVNGKRKKVSLKTSRQDEALAAAKDLLRPALAATREEVALHIARARRLHTARDITIDQVWREFVASPGRRECSARTLSGYESCWNAFASWLRGNHPDVAVLAGVTEDIALDYAAHLRDERAIAASTYNAHRNLLAMLTRTLARRAGIDENPWDQVPRREIGRDTATRKELTEEQVLTLLHWIESRTHADDPALPFAREWLVAFHLGAFAGLRLADCVMLTWDSYDAGRNQLSLIPAKTSRTMKRVHLPVHPRLRHQLEQATGWRQPDCAYVCPNLATRYDSSPSTVQKEAMIPFEQADLGVQIRESRPGRSRKVTLYGFHSLRHSFVSFCANAGVPLAVVQALVGHGNPAMTRHYTHISQEAAQEAIAALPIAIEGSGQSAPSQDAQSRLDAALGVLQAADRLTEREQRLLDILAPGN